MKLNEGQQIFSDHVAENKPQNLIANCVAGSGKTSMIVHGISRMPVTRHNSAIMLSFSKDVQQSLARRTGKPDVCKTLHSHGLSQITKNIGWVKTDKSKTWKLVEHMAKKWKDVNPKELNGFKYKVAQLVRFGKMSLAMGVADVEAAGLRCGIESMSGEAEKAWEILQISAKSLKSIDMEDMLWLPCVYAKQWHFDKYHTVIIDEVQDCSPSLLRFSDIIRHDQGRLITTGDEFQNIYSSFAGADPILFDKLRKRPNTREVTLDYTYRCSEAICQRARKFVPNITPWEGARKGSIGARRMSDIENGMVVCRNNAPLMKAYIYLMSKGVKSSLIGKSHGEKLMRLIRASNAQTLGQLEKYMNKRIERVVTKLMKAPYNLPERAARRAESVKIMRDELEMITILSGISTSLSDLYNKLRKMFTDKREGVVLQTVHKAKGQETVGDTPLYILDKELIWKNNKTQLDHTEARNIEYTAWTRGKVDAYLVESIKRKKS